MHNGSSIHKLSVKQQIFLDFYHKSPYNSPGMIEARCLSVARKRRGNARGKGNIAEICIFFPEYAGWSAGEYAADCHIGEALQSKASCGELSWHYASMHRCGRVGSRSFLFFGVQTKEELS